MEPDVWVFTDPYVLRVVNHVSDGFTASHCSRKSEIGKNQSRIKLLGIAA
jgi:hypothetical protein